jgi:hypothetical protein
MRLVPISALVFAALAALGPVIAAFLRIGTATVWMVAGYAFFSLLLAVPLGCLQGTPCVPPVRQTTMVGVVARFAVGVGLVRVGLGPTGAVAGSVASQALMLAFGLRSLGSPRRTIRSASPRSS